MDHDKEAMCGWGHHRGFHGKHHAKYQGRRFLTTEEKIARLKEYKEWLDNESRGVAEAIEKLEKAS
jgi:hypothetical protein